MKCCTDFQVTTLYSHSCLRPSSNLNLIVMVALFKLITALNDACFQATQALWSVVISETATVSQDPVSAFSTCAEWSANKGLRCHKAISPQCLSTLLTINVFSLIFSEFHVISHPLACHNNLWCQNQGNFCSCQFKTLVKLNRKVCSNLPEHLF